MTAKLTIPPAGPKAEMAYHERSVFLVQLPARLLDRILEARDGMGVSRNEAIERLVELGLQRWTEEEERKP